MKWLAVLLLVAGCSSAARPPAPSFGPGTTELVHLSKDFNAAFTLRDAKKLDELTLPEYTFHYIDHERKALSTAPRGRWSEELFARLKNGPLQWSVVDVRVYGDTGIVIGYYRWLGSWGGTRFDHEGYVTDIWVRRGRSWKALASHATITR